MENNLYYTPTISEFYVGFEYEEYQFLEKNWKTVKCEFIKPNTTIDPKWFRVKTLNQSDIESLGWKYDVNMSELEYDSFYIEPGYDNKNRFIQYSLQNYKNGKVYLDKCINSGVHEIGFITIKNKSELIKLMQQLNIK